MHNIQLFVPTFQIDECLNEIKECLEKGWTGLGFKTIEFENAWKNHTNIPNAYFINSNTVGLHLAIKLFKQEYKWKDGDEIISTPLTFVSTNHAILYENLKPVFADVDETLCLNPSAVEKCITSKTKAVMYVGMGGNTGNIEKIIDICKKNNLLLILDAAHMAGTYLNGKHIGNEADCTVFSFQAVKNLPTADSGMICFKNKEFDAKVRKLGWLGIDQDTYARTTNGNKGNYKWMYEVNDVGLKAHGNSIIAALGIVQLKYLERDNKIRREISQKYQQALSQIKQIRFAVFPENCLPSRHLFQIRVPKQDRNQLILHMNADKIFPGVHYRANTFYKMYQYALGTCPNAELAGDELISLPLHLKLSNEDIDRVINSIATYFSKI